MPFLRNGLVLFHGYLVSILVLSALVIDMICDESLAGREDLGVVDSTVYLWHGLGRRFELRFAWGKKGRKPDKDGEWFLHRS